MPPRGNYTKSSATHFLFHALDLPLALYQPPATCGNWGLLKRCALSIKYILNFEDLIWKKNSVILIMITCWDDKTFWCQKLSFSVPCAKSNLADSFGWSRKGELYCFARQRGTQWAKALKPCVLTWGRQWEVLYQLFVCIPWWDTLYPLSKGCSWLFLLVLHPFSSLNNSCFNLTGTQGRSWRLNEGYFLKSKKWGTQSAVPRRHTEPCSVLFWIC